MLEKWTKRSGKQSSFSGVSEMTLWIPPTDVVDSSENYVIQHLPNPFGVSPSFVMISDATSSLFLILISSIVATSNKARSSSFFFGPLRDGVLITQRCWTSPFMDIPSTKNVRH
ncbi:hypothetical protein ADUPG1_007224 [Aduncisulcus paluster]|uniref:Uncharacterized protein n=1 Tax=Aduncisulcus paluster TaxID=2918883 RepID=A0ABQ5KP03_9EUKA|nr:hypothetical protein ADUPG1_007224 [Aduncisulcus paluster]